MLIVEWVEPILRLRRQVAQSCRNNSFSFHIGELLVVALRLHLVAEEENESAAAGQVGVQNASLLAAESADIAQDHAVETSQVRFDQGAFCDLGYLNCAAILRTWIQSKGHVAGFA